MFVKHSLRVVALLEQLALARDRDVPQLLLDALVA
jgi:hypothetical protein